MANIESLDICPDCKVVLPAVDGERHPYLGGSAACWALYGRLLAKEYGDPAYMRAHRMTVDAYAAQHPGLPEPRTIQSIHVHLVGLHLTLERGLNADFARKVIARVTRQKDRLLWLTPPASLGDLTIADVMLAVTADDHHAAVSRWARVVWEAWRPHHDEVIALAKRTLEEL